MGCVKVLATHGRMIPNVTVLNARKRGDKDIISRRPYMVCFDVMKIYNTIMFSHVISQSAISVSNISLCKSGDY